ncbi:hypothetical protein J6590_054392 [Homalodisca vitripennis]|nr:hypothetical protein J6590_054392 [Homalodisca vitripennis]
MSRSAVIAVVCRAADVPPVATPTSPPPHHVTLSAVTPPVALGDSLTPLPSPPAPPLYSPDASLSHLLIAKSNSPTAILLSGRAERSALSPHSVPVAIMRQMTAKNVDCTVEPSNVTALQTSGLPTVKSGVSQTGRRARPH